jgi:hypothetical protein
VSGKAHSLRPDGTAMGRRRASPQASVPSRRQRYPRRWSPADRRAALVRYRSPRVPSRLEAACRQCILQGPHISKPRNFSFPYPLCRDRTH